MLTILLTKQQLGNNQPVLDACQSRFYSSGCLINGINRENIGLSCYRCLMLLTYLAMNKPATNVVII
jgi:hypothetical protein